ncbi:MAG TPA: extradiol dioxygenase [Flavobacterium sp.]|uniref:VOC family protein n=1 Tax=Flavobacterium sp. TaxID=239 RepID=UPI002CAB8F46|nr:VOC family protein [Flavobacterium sp.]HNP32861.1 extradiol dioxygenase [Flavobacterium sp.]
MTKQIWLNLPVKDALKAKDFYSQMGFTFLEERTTEQSACMLVGESNFVVMLFGEDMFRNFIQHQITDTKQSSEFLISIDAESREEVDTLAQKAKAAGGIVYAEPGENQGWMYGCGFCDLDGHRWNVLYMDFSKMPQH